MLNNKHLYWIIFVAASSGLLLGLNIAGISGAVSSIQSFFNLTDHALGIVVSSLIIGSLFGAFSSGHFIEKYGRKKVLMFSSILFVISSLGGAFSQSVISLVVFRLIGGIGMGIVSVVGPIYISEISPPKQRGMLVTFYTLAIVTGILLAYIFNYFFMDVANGWRYMLAVPFIFSILVMIFILNFLPESPRWLIVNGRKLEAFDILKKAHGSELAKEEFHDIENSHSFKIKKISLMYIFKGKVGKLVFLGVILAIFQQLVGINAVINYAPIIFEKTGVNENIAIFQSIFVGIVNFLATFIVIKFIDSKGRKTLLIWGALGMTLTLAYISYAFAFNLSNIGILIATLLFTAFFAGSFAPMLGVITSELFSNHFRGIAVSFVSTVNWIFTFFVLQFSPYILNRFGGAILFGTFALCSFLALIFVKIWIPETKGKSLEEIEKKLF
jgi:sugar porter (SP) family MFS transporter